MANIGATLETVEREHILATYKFNGGNKARTALMLGIAVNTLTAKLEKYGEGTKTDRGDSVRLATYSGETANSFPERTVPPAPAHSPAAPEEPPKEQHRKSGRRNS